MNEEYLDLLVDLHKHQIRQGPGGDAQTGNAITLANLQKSERLAIADIGCGTGASSIYLARHLNAQITAVDIVPEFIEILRTKASAEGLTEYINPVVCSMEQLPFAEGTFDVIWSEGAIYNIGFEKGVNEWRRFLKPSGMLVVSEITWLTSARPTEIQAYWNAEYPEITSASSKIKVLEESGYTPVGYFVLPESSWLDNYYCPLQAQLPEFHKRHDGNEVAASIVEAEKREFDLYQQYMAFYSYGMYVAQNSDDQRKQ